jgi:molecular chaperone DnaK (HSP70)
MSLNIGIDFGTSTLIIARWNEQKMVPEVVPNIVPALFGTNEQLDNAVYYEENFDISLGRIALKKLSVDPQNGVREIKRNLDDNNWTKNIHGLDKTAVDIMQDVFTYIEQQLRKVYGNETIDNVVISVPYAFEQKERKKIEQAATQSNLPVIALIEEPVAAALASGLFDFLEPNKKENVLIFDFGGGTFDVTIFEAIINAENQKSISVLSTDGDSHLGGVDVDRIIINKIIENFDKAIEVDSLSEIEKNRIDYTLFEEARGIKHDLSEADSVPVFIVLENHDVVSEFIYERADLEAALEVSIISKIKKVIHRVLDGANLRPNQIDEIILVGGSSNIPSVSNIVNSIFGRSPKIIDDPSVLVGKGAAIYCGILANKVNDIVIQRRTNQGYGIKQGDRVKLLLAKNETYLTSSPYYDVVIPISKPGGKIPIYKSENGDLLNSEKIGFINVITSQYQRNQVRIQLFISKNGSLCFRTHNVSGELVSEGDVVKV